MNWDKHAEKVEQAIDLYQAVDDINTVAKAAVSAAAIAGATTSGAGIMSSLAAAAGVGGGVVGGISALGTGPAVVASLAMNQVLKDDKRLSSNEREARAVGRTMTTVGATAGTMGAVGAIAASGSVAGLSAAGITSGLAAIGGTVGGGMLAGTTIAVAAPAVAATAIGYGAYKAWKWLTE